MTHRILIRILFNVITANTESNITLGGLVKHTIMLLLFTLAKRSQFKIYTSPLF